MKFLKRLASTMLVLLPMAVLFVAQVAGAQACDPAKEFCNILNPEFSSVPNFISGFLKVVVMIALPIISLFIVYSGFLFVSARGNEGQLQEAKKNFFYVIIGAILILGAWVLATMIAGTVSQIIR